jgi:predicted Fe-S protein YdhL (DUF1289 family)
VTDLFRTPASPAPTPCGSVCAIDPASGYCSGCARSRAEIAAWSAASEEEKRGVWRVLPERRERLGLTCWRLPWTGVEILAFASLTLRERLGLWTLGLPGASLCFDEPCEVERCGTRLTARGQRTVMKLDVPGNSAAFAYLTDDTLNIGLAVPRAHGVLPVRDVVTPLGPDPAPLAENRDGVRFDLGLGSPALRVSVRTAAWRPLQDFARLSGRRWTRDGMSPDREPLDLILETGLGRIERAAVDLHGLDMTAPQPQAPGWPLASNFLPGAQVRVLDGALAQTLGGL